jgi:hypothetical protein
LLMQSSQYIGPQLSAFIFTYISTEHSRPHHHLLPVHARYLCTASCLLLIQEMHNLNLTVIKYLICISFINCFWC